MENIAKDSETSGQTFLRNSFGDSLGKPKQADSF